MSADEDVENFVSNITEQFSGEYTLNQTQNDEQIPEWRLKDKNVWIWKIAGVWQIGDQSEGGAIFKSAEGNVDCPILVQSWKYNGSEVDSNTLKIQLKLVPNETSPTATEPNRSQLTDKATTLTKVRWHP